MTCHLCEILIVERKINQHQAKYCADCRTRYPKECARDRQRRWRERNKKAEKQRFKQYYEESREYLLAKRKRDYWKDAEKERERKRVAYRKSIA